VAAFGIGARPRDALTKLLDQQVAALKVTRTAFATFEDLIHSVIATQWRSVVILEHRSCTGVIRLLLGFSDDILQHLDQLPHAGFVVDELGC